MKKGMVHFVSSISCAAALMLSGLNGRAQGASITFDFDSTYQTIDGFGGFGAMNVWWSNGPFYNDAFFRMIIDEIGMTLIRTEAYPRPDQEGNNTKQVNYLRSVKQYAHSRGEPLTFFATVWTPPARMKTNNNTSGGGLIAGKEGEFAEYLVDYIKWFKEQVGEDLVAIGPANEPQAEHFFNSNQMSAQQMGTVVVETARAMQNADLSTSVAFSDDLSNHAIYHRDVLLAIRSIDPAVLATADISTMHYGGDDWRLYAPYGGPAFNEGRRAWNTEFGNGPDNWDHAWSNTKAMYHMLNWNYSAIVFWLIGPHSNPGQAEESLVYNLQMGPKAWGARAFFRFIRPGAIRVKCTNDHPDLYTLAFVHPVNKTLSIILINEASSALTVTIPTGSGLPSHWDVHLTGSGNNGVTAGTVSAGESVSIPSRTVATLYNPDAPIGDLAVGATAAPRPIGAAQHTVRTTALFGIDGRRMDASAAGTRAGVRIQVAGPAQHGVARIVVGGN